MEIKAESEVKMVNIELIIKNARGSVQKYYKW